MRYGAWTLAMLLLAGCEDTQKPAEQKTAESQDQKTVTALKEEGEVAAKVEEMTEAEASAKPNVEEETVTASPKLEETQPETDHSTRAPKEELEVSEAPFATSTSEESKEAKKTETETAKQTDNARKDTELATTESKAKNSVSKEIKEPVAYVYERWTELQSLHAGPAFVQWIREYGATILIARRVFGKDISKSKDALEQHFWKTFPEFISANIETFLVMLNDYLLEKVEQSQAEKSFTKFSVHLVDKKSKAPVKAEIIATTRGLRVMDITIKETGLISLLKTSVKDILALPKEKQKAAWESFINGRKG